MDMIKKIKGMVPGGQKTGGHGQGHAANGGYGTTTGTTGYGGNKGMMGKIKEMLPGGGHKTHGHGTTTTTGTTGYGGKKGMVEKIKEMVPGAHKTHGHR